MRTEFEKVKKSEILQKNYIEMEFTNCSASGSKFKRSKEYKQRLNNRHLTSLNEYYCQCCSKISILGNENSHLNFIRLKNSKLVGHCDVYNIDVNAN